MRHIKKWRERWTNSTRGRHNYEFFPDVNERLGEKKKDSAKLILHTDSDGACIIPGQAAMDNH